MKKIVNTNFIFHNQTLTHRNVLNNPKNHHINKDFQNQYTYIIKMHPKKGKIIKRQDITSDSIHIKSSKKNSSSMNQENGWFSILDEHGCEGFLRLGHITINKNREVSMDNYVLLSINDQPIRVPENKKILIKSEGMIVIKEDDNKKNHKPIKLGQLKFVSLSENDIIERYDSKVCDLNDSGFKKYKQNELDLKTMFSSDETIKKNKEQETKNFLKTLNIIRSLESDMKINPNNN